MSQPIFLDKQDIFAIWEMTGNRQAEEPFKNLRQFLNYYKMEHDTEYVPDMFEFNYSNKNGHPSRTLDRLVDFAEFFDGKIKIDENFIRLMNSLPKDTNTSSAIRTFRSLNDKYPDFFSQLTEAMDERNTVNYHESNIIAGWIALVKDNKIDFKGQELFGFMQQNLYETERTLVKKIDILNRFDLDKTLSVLDTTLRQNEKNPTIIDAIAQYYKKNNLSHNKTEIPIFTANEQRLFHYHMNFQPEGLMQKRNLSEKEARNVLIWACYYLAEHAYGGVVCERKTGEEKNFNHNKEITLHVTTPYESALQELKPIYEEALDVLFNSEFLTQERLTGLQVDRFDEHLAKQFKAFIKPAKLQQELSNKLSLKEEKSPKMKI